MASMMEAERAVGAREYRARMQSMNAVQRHREHMEVLRLYAGSSPAPAATQPALSDYDILCQEHRFIRDDERDAHTQDWKVQMARSYYNKLYREYAIVDLKHYKSGNIGLRWRTEPECISGKGQFVCGNRKCSETEALQTIEVPFQYVEQDEEKAALVKLRVCERCAVKLNYKRKKRKKRKRSVEE